MALGLMVALTGCGGRVTALEGASGGSASNPGSDWLSENICSGKTILGRLGTAACGLLLGDLTGSNVSRNPGVIVHPNLATADQPTSSQLTLKEEASDYADEDLPTTGGYGYRDVPKILKDDEGYDGFNVAYAPRPTLVCGSSGSIEDRIADCVTQNASSSTWDGSTQGNSGQGTWKLVSMIAANKEVWRDERTKLVWSSQVSASANWCRASGSTEMSPYYLSAAFNLGSAAATQLTAKDPAGALPTAALTGNGTIGSFQNLSTNTAISETLRLTYNSGTGVFDILSSSGNNANSCLTDGVTPGSWSGTLGVAGSQITWTRAGVCSFTVTQGSVAFASNDRFVVKNDGPSVSCYAGGALQASPAVSFCAEDGSLSPAIGTENWTTGIYDDAKGQMGKLSTTPVRWRLPTRNDFNQAEINGIRSVLPDMGIEGYKRPSPDTSLGTTSSFWSASVYSFSRNFAWFFNGNIDNVNINNRNNNNSVRCVGR